MHRGQNPVYHRAPVPRSPYGPQPGAGATFPQQYHNTVAYPSRVSGPPPGGEAFSGPGFQSFSNEQIYQCNQFQPGWTHQPDLQGLEVKRKAEEFLRILGTKERMEMGGELKEKGSRSRSRSRNRSRGRSRGKSRARSRGKSRPRSRSRSRGKSRTRTKSRARSRSRSKSRSRSMRSKSQPRLHSAAPHESSSQKSAVLSGTTLPELYQNLRQVLQSKDLEKHLDALKITVMNQSQAAPLQTSVPELEKKVPEPMVPELNQNSVLPHELVSSTNGPLPRILSWDDPSQLQGLLQTHRPLCSIEDEEEFLYGEEEERKKPQAVTVPLAQTRPAHNLPPSPHSIKPAAHQESRAQTVPAGQEHTPEVTPEECARVKNMLKTIGLNLSIDDIKKMAARLKQKQEEQKDPASNAALRALTESLPNRKKSNTLTSQKSDETRSNRSEGSHSHRDAEINVKEKRENQIQKKRKEYLVKELEGLLKHEGSGDLIPVIGFFCQRCEEFFSDLSSAENHKHAPSQPLPDKHRADNKRPRDLKEAARGEPDRKRMWVERSPPRKEKLKEGKDEKKADAELSKSAKKKKKKEKKMKKKEKKKKKKKEKAKKKSAA